MVDLHICWRRVDIQRARGCMYHVGHSQGCVLEDSRVPLPTSQIMMGQDSQRPQVSGQRVLKGPTTE